MSENCDQNCGSCMEDCADRTEQPVDPKKSKACSAGTIEGINDNWLDRTANIFEKIENNVMIKISVACEGGIDK
ncbi:MAG TPA: hypothetical protein VFD19_00685 [Clostridia bacterium]|nr:hypothetical protein [Clostridia bacterium]